MKFKKKLFTLLLGGGILAAGAVAAPLIITSCSSGEETPAPTITKVEAVGTTTGDKSTLTITVTGTNLVAANLTFTLKKEGQQNKSITNTATGSGTSVTLTLDNVTAADYNGWTVTVADKNNASVTKTSNEISFTTEGPIDTTPSITIESTNETINTTTGQNITIKIQSSNLPTTGTNKYEWQYQKDDTTDWTPFGNNKITSTDNSTWTIDAANNKQAFSGKIRVVVTNGSTTITSNAVTLNITVATGEGTITIESTNETINTTTGQNITIKIQSSNLPTTGTNKYEWQYQKDDTTDWTPFGNNKITSTDNSTWTIDAANNKQAFSGKIRVVVTNGSTTITSNAVTLNITVAPSK